MNYHLFNPNRLTQTVIGLLFCCALFAQNTKFFTLTQEGVRYFEQGEYQLAEESFLKVINSIDATNDDKYISYQKLSFLYLMIEDYSNALFYGESAKDIALRSFGVGSEMYKESINLLLMVYSNIGSHDKIVQCQTELLKYTKANYSSPHSEIAFSYLDLANAYNDRGNYTQGIEFYNNAREEFLELSERDTENSEKNKLMVLLVDSYRLHTYVLCGQVEYASQLSLEVKEMLNSIPYNNENVLYRKICDNLSKYYLTIDDLSTAIIYIKRILPGLEKDFANGENIEQYSNTLWRVGFLQYFGSSADDESAEREACINLKKYINIYRKYSDILSPSFYERYKICCRILLESRDLESSNFLNQLITDSQDIISRTFSELTINERNELWNESFCSENSYGNLKDIVFSSNEHISPEIIYNYWLLSKGILLSSAINTNVVIDQYGTEEEISLWNEVKNNEKQIVELEKQNDFTAITDSLRYINSQIERKLLSDNNISNHIKSFYATDFHDVKSQLYDNEVIVDFVSYQNLLEEEKSYAAFVIRKDFSTPEFVHLFNESDLGVLSNTKTDRVFANLNQQSILYNIVWRPLHKYIEKRDKVYIIPDGIINNLPIENLEEYICYEKQNKLKTYRISSAKSIRLYKPTIKYTSASLFGGIDYTISGDQPSCSGIFFSDNLRVSVDTSITRAGWNYLPYTAIETSNIFNALNKSNVSVNLYQGIEGTEDNFKLQSTISPSIIHIATHGYYVSSRDAIKVAYLPNEIREEDIHSYADYFQETPDYSLIRSGLIMAGGEASWVNGHTDLAYEDGILTAQEISELDLSDTELVVLSSCNSGLGDVREDGVFGLQRSLKISGVNTIIMSLWEVDDQATAYMMENFYKNLLKGQTKKEAFVAAQKHVKKTFPNPRYWAAFIMLD